MTDVTEPRHQPGEPDDDTPERYVGLGAHWYAHAVIGALLDLERVELAVSLDHDELREAVGPLPGLGWTPPMLTALVEHRAWPADATPATVLNALAQLGPPPERPRSAGAGRPGECPEHVGEPVGRCAVCAAGASLLDPEDHSSFAAAARARVRPYTPRDGLALGQRDGGAA